MNRDALIELIHGGHKSGNLQIGSLAQNVQRPCAIFATAPTQQSLPGHLRLASAQQIDE